MYNIINVKQIIFLISFFLISNYTKAQSNSNNNQALQQIYTTKEDSFKLRLIKEFVDKTIDTDTKLAGYWIGEGIKLATQKNNINRLIDFHLQDLRLSNQQGLFKQTIEKASKVETLVKKSGTPLQQVARLTSTANAMQKIGLYDSAAIIYNKVIIICRDLDLKEVEVNASMNIAILFQYQNRIAEMKDYLLNTLALAKKYRLPNNIASIKINLSNAEARLNNYGKAIDYLQDVIPHYTNINNQFALGLIYSNLSWCYFKSDKLNDALNYARKSYTIRSALKDAAGLTHLELNLSKIFLATAKYDSANFYAQSSLKKSIELNITSDIRDNYETLAQINQQLRNYSLALDYMKLYADWKDSVNSKEKNKLVEQELQKIRYDSLQHLKQRIQVLEQQKANFKKANLILIAIVVIALFAITLYFRKRIQKEKIPNNANELDWQKKYYENIKESELLKEKLINQNTQLEKELQKQQRSSIDALRDLIESNKLHTDSYWNEFLLIFSKVYPTFFKTIKDSYPDLTQHELKLCAMIKLNHSSLDMAKALNITVDSVRKARYRLYKKMNLNDDQEMVDLIIKY